MPHHPVLEMACAQCGTIADVFSRCPRCSPPWRRWGMLGLGVLTSLVLLFALFGCGMTYYKNSQFYQSLTPFQQWQYDHEVQRSLRETSNALLEAGKPVYAPPLPVPVYAPSPRPVTCSYTQWSKTVTCS